VRTYLNALNRLDPAALAMARSFASYPAPPPLSVADRAAFDFAPELGRLRFRMPPEMSPVHRAQGGPVGGVLEGTIGISGARQGVEVGGVIELRLPPGVEATDLTSPGQRRVFFKFVRDNRRSLSRLLQD
jgi:hypothetical protein